MNVKSQLISVFKPTITLDEISILDEESVGPNQESKGNTRQSQIIGYLSPYIKINDFVFDYHEIEMLTLREDSFLPTLSVTLVDVRGHFKSAYFPRNNSIMSLYIRSKHDKLKCVRNDFLITKINAIESDDIEYASDGKGIMFTIEGTLLVPMIYDNTPKSYKNFTSLEVMQQLAHDMQLGFATNEEYTNDSMTWIKPLTKKTNFLEHVLAYAFKSDTAYYDGFIDKYYHMNFINVAEMLAVKDDDANFEKYFEKIMTWADLKDSQADAPGAENPAGEFILSNWIKLGDSDLRIISFTPITRQGEQLVDSGYIRNIGYYDVMLSKSITEKFIELDVKPINNALIPGKYRKNASMNIMSQNFNGEWCGIDYNNAHANYNYAQIQNEHNLNDIKKIQLYIKLNGMNLNLLRGMRVPVMIILEGRDTINMMKANISPDEEAANLNAKEEEIMQIWYDKYLSGNYYISSLIYNYDKDEGAFTTEALLSRSNWSKKEPELFKKT